MALLDRLIPLRLLPSPSEELAALTLRQVRVENRFGLHLAAWIPGSFFFAATFGADETADQTAARMREEMRLARELQRSILPEKAPRLDGLRVAHAYRPSSEVGGDFYDFYNSRPGRLLLALGDASGHGLDASMVSSMAKSALYLQAAAGSDPAATMAELNRMMFDTLGRRRLMTLALLEVDAGRRTLALALANAGQLYPLLVRGGRVEELELPSYPLGVRRPGAAPEPSPARSP